jgi:NAD(P)H-dependent FMN reductase
MNTSSLRLAVILGSVREGRFGPNVANWFARVAGQRDEFEVDLIDLDDFNFPSNMTQNYDTRHFAERIGAADAVVIVTPEYNHMFPGPLKTAIDSLKSEWQAKPVGFISYGGVAGGLRAVEPLRIVFAELHAVTLRDVISFPMFPDKFDADGDPIENDMLATALA